MTTKRKIFFRADAGQEIGYGHFIRSLALADMLKDDFDCVFYTQNPTDYQRKEAANVCPLVELPADNSKFDIFLGKLTGNEIVVLDNYFYTTDYQRRIKEKGCKLVCIDDMHDKHYVADVVINHGCNEPSLFSIEPYTRLCLGFDYALLRKPFLEAEPLETRHQGHVIVTFGGSDWNNLTAKYARILSQREDVLKITTIIGDAYQYLTELQTIPKVDIIKNLTALQMANLFCTAQCAVLPASSVCIEALACQCPVFAMWYVKNQKAFYEYLVRENYVNSLALIENGHNIRIDSVTNKHAISSKNINNNIIAAFNYGK